jgi:protein TonB
MNNKKSSGANLEKRRGIFLKSGFIIAMILVLMAFEYKIYERSVQPLYQGLTEVVEVDYIQVTIPKPPPPPLPPSQEIIVAPNEAEIDDIDFIVDFGADAGTEVPIYDLLVSQKPEEIIPGDDIVHHPETMPEFPGGIRELYLFLGEELRYPSAARELGVSGTVFVGFVIEKDGTVSDVRVLRGIGGGCDEEAVRVVNAMPPWNPGKMGIHPVRVSYSLPIRFLLQK